MREDTKCIVNSNKTEGWIFRIFPRLTCAGRVCVTKGSKLIIFQQVAKWTWLGPSPSENQPCPKLKGEQNYANYHTLCSAPYAIYILFICYEIMWG